MLYTLRLILLISSVYWSSAELLETKQESDVIQLINDEKYVIVLLSDSQACLNKCEVLERSLVSVREELVEATGAWVIKSYSPKLNIDFGLKEPSLLFFRHGIPLLYHGSIDDEEDILRYFGGNKESSVHILNDENFEHDTQAASGSTTGDWLVLFIRDDEHPKSKLVRPTIEAVAVNLKGKKNVAVVNREMGGSVTTRRFGVKVFPTFILFRLGNMYQYTLPIVDVSAMTAFAMEGFRNAKVEKVSAPKSPFDDLVEKIADWLRENPFQFLLMVGGVILIGLILYLLNRPPPESWMKKKKKSH